MNPWLAARSAALNRLECFLPRAGSAYSRNRNTDLGPEKRENVSGLSAWVRYRILTEREVLARVLDKHSATAAEKFIQEVFWRTYWKGWLEQRPAVWHGFVDECRKETQRRQRDPELDQAVNRAESGQTGIDGFDDWARELVETGYLHNHARMWFASIWIFTLRLPWVLGADFFLRHLLDADPASNTLSWRWVAGLQTRGKTYLATADNIARYTDGRFQPRGLAEQAEPLSGPEVPSPRPLPDALSERGTHLDNQVLLVTPEDLNPESLIKAGGRPAKVLLLGPEAFAPDWPWGGKAKAFLAVAVDDTWSRLADVPDLSVTRLNRLDGESLKSELDPLGLDRMLTACAPVGPVADALSRLGSELDSTGIRLEFIQRDWDAAAWPHARRGFFPFRKHIPDLLARAGLV